MKVIPKSHMKLLKIGGRLFHSHIHRHTHSPSIGSSALSRHGGSIIKPKYKSVLNNLQPKRFVKL